MFSIMKGKNTFLFDLVKIILGMGCEIWGWGVGTEYKLVCVYTLINILGVPPLG